MKEGCMIVKCERCGSESQLMMHSIRSNAFLCPVCMENEIKCQLTDPETQTHCDLLNTDLLYPYVTDPVTISTN